jgi:hypothetical protein
MSQSQRGRGSKCTDAFKQKLVAESRGDGRKQARRSNQPNTP